MLTIQEPYIKSVTNTIQRKSLQYFPTRRELFTTVMEILRRYWRRLTSDVEFWLLCVRSGVPFLQQMNVKIYKLIRSFPITRTYLREPANMRTEKEQRRDEKNRRGRRDDGLAETQIIHKCKLTVYSSLPRHVWAPFSNPFVSVSLYLSFICLHGNHGESVMKQECVSVAPQNNLGHQIFCLFIPFNFCDIACGFPFAVTL